MNKKFVSLTLSVLMALSIVTFTGCAAKDTGGETTTAPTTTTQPETTTQAKNVSVADLAEKVKSASTQITTMEMEEDIAKDFYNLDLSLLEEYSFNIAMMNVKCDEISIAKVKDAKDIETVKKAMEYRYENIMKTWEMYLPDQLEIAKKGKIVAEGNYVMLIVAEGVEDGIKTFQDELA